MSNHTLSNSPKVEKKVRNTTGHNSVSKSSLPKLSQMIRGGNSPPSINKKKKYKGNILMIEGKSKIIEENRSH